MHCVIFTGGELVKSRLISEEILKADLIIAADNGAKTALHFGVTPKIVIGDFDSLDKKTKLFLKEKNVEFVIFPTEKDETDTELAIVYASKKGATEITLLGGIYGDRIDHIVANIMYTTVSKIPITFINGLQKSFVRKGPVSTSLSGKKNDLLSLIPLTENVTGLNSKNLQWKLSNSTLVFGKPRGVSNVFTQDKVTLSWRKGWLFITHTHQV